MVQKKPYGDNVERRTPFVVKWTCGQATARDNKRRTFEMNDTNSLSHTKWNCKYHIVFAPKYRRKVFYKEKRSRRNTTNIVRVEESKDSRGRSMSRSCTYAGRNPAEDISIKFYGVFEGKKQPDDI